MPKKLEKEIRKLNKRMNNQEDSNRRDLIIALTALAITFFISAITSSLNWVSEYFKHILEMASSVLYFIAGVLFVILAVKVKWPKLKSK